MSMKVVVELIMMMIMLSFSKEFICFKSGEYTIRIMITMSTEIYDNDDILVRLRLK